MLKIEKLIDYTIPLFGNRRIFPYGKLRVTDGTTTEIKPIRDDGARQYIVFRRKRHYVRNVGTLYSPRFAFVED